MAKAAFDAPDPDSGSESGAGKPGGATARSAIATAMAAGSAAANASGSPNGATPNSAPATTAITTADSGATGSSIAPVLAAISMPAADPAPATDSIPATDSAAKSIWRSRDYLSWWIGTTVSALGSTLSAIAFPLLMLYQTGSVAQAGAIAALENVGRLTTLLIGGVLADRFSRKFLLVAAPLIQALAVGAVVPLVLTHHVSIVWLGAVAVVQGLVNGLSGGAMLPALKRIVPAEQFPAASASRQGRDMAAELVGPPVGGILFAAARWAPFVGDAVSYLAAAIGSALIRTPLGPDRDDDTPHEPIRRQLAEGWRFIRSNDYMRFITAWVPIVNALFMVLFLLVLALVRHRGGGPLAVGAANAIAAVGGLTGALFTPWLVREVRGRTLVIIASWVLAIGAVAAAFAPRPWLIGAVFGVALVMAAPLYSVLESHQVKMIPDELLGRVSTLLTFLNVGLLWIAPIVAGLLADFFSPVTAEVVGGGVLAVLAVWVQRAKSLHQLDENRQAADLPVDQKS